ncbi:MAG: transcription antitermination protein NusB, partial [Candidatus Roizmanbacteria bacterium]|nr:transcription antitermination protein NusB [Candidatus Roizmanbacteria bacterium]
LIKKYAPKYPLDKIAKVDLAILQLAVYELMFEKKQPAKVIIDEAVELAKELGSDKAYAFVNAVMGKVYNNQINKSDK